MTSSKLAGLYSASRILVAQEYAFLSVYGSLFHLRSDKPQLGILMMIECCISVFHWNSVSIPGDRLVIEVHDYAQFSKEISDNNHIICA
jgi:hypothetical protein